MKRIVLGAFALVFAFFSSANAADVKLGGLFQQIVGFGDDTTGGITHVFDRFNISASTTTDNGWEVGGNWQHQAAYYGGASAGPEELKMYIKTDMGTVNIGNTVDAVTSRHARVNGMVPGGGVDAGYQFSFAGGLEGSRGVQFSEAYYAYNGHRVVYTAPSINGITVSASYTPTQSQNNIGSGSRTANNFSDTNHQETIEVGASWSGEFEGMTVTASVGSKNGNGVAAWPDGNDLSVLSGVIQISQGDWTIGYMVYENGDSYGQSTDSTKAASSGWGTAATYNLGNITIGAGYVYQEAVNGETYNTSTGDDSPSQVRSSNVTMLGIAYSLGGGVDTYVQLSDYDNNDGNSMTSETNPQVVFAGMSLGF